MTSSSSCSRAKWSAAVRTCALILVAVMTLACVPSLADDPIWPNCQRGTTTAVDPNWETEARCHWWCVYDPNWNVIATMEEQNGWGVIGCYGGQMSITVPASATIADGYFAFHGDGVDPSIGVHFDVVQ